MTAADVFEVGYYDPDPVVMAPERREHGFGLVVALALCVGIWVGVFVVLAVALPGSWLLNVASAFAVACVLTIAVVLGCARWGEL